MKDKPDKVDKTSENLTVREQMQALYQFFGHKDNIIWDCYQRDQKIHVRNKVALVFGSGQQVAPVTGKKTKMADRTKTVSKDAIEDATKEAIDESSSDSNEEDEGLLEEGSTKISAKAAKKGKDLEKEEKKRIREEKKLNSKIDEITNSIWKQAQYTDGILMMSIIYLAVIKPNIKKDHSEDNVEEVKDYSMYPVFRVMKCVKNKSSHNCCMIFVDDHARVYSNWEDFRQSNLLPESTIVAPECGVYNCTGNGRVLLEVFAPPASRIEYKILTGIDRAADVIGIVAAIAALVAIGLIAWVPLAASIAVVIFTVASSVSAVASAWSAIRSAMKLADRKKHERPNTLDNKEARSCWLGAVGGATGLAAGIAGTGMSQMIRNGQKIPTIMRCMVDAIFIANIIMQKLSLVNDYFDVMFKVKDKNVSALDFIRLAASIAVFIHSVNNFKVAKLVIRSHQQSTISAFRDILSADQQKVFDRMARETVRIRGEYAGNADIIRSLRNNPFVRENIDSRVQVNNLIRQQNWKDTSAHTANVLKNFKGSLHDDDLLAIVVNIRQKISHDAFEIFKGFVIVYVEVHGDRIERELNRFIPMEEFMSNIFKVLCTEARDNGQNVDEFIMQTQLENQLYLFEQINKFYEQFCMRPPNELCRQCGGKYFKAE
ncbi:uncharacterized protein LOC129791661 [Lutzomyia longipalpis]|uniref:uncharacterized protein LOC129791661 n=1 Tax=Lutzomyia longipalpis TaxID=7200 RepID=UPI002483A09D|nr:uncharacterized protein LOC129791661 [Lutzomyia longipalpis]